MTSVKGYKLDIALVNAGQGQVISEARTMRLHFVYISHDSTEYR